MGAKCKTKAAVVGEGRWEGDPTAQKPGGGDERYEWERRAGPLALSQARLGIFVQRARECLCHISMSGAGAPYIWLTAHDGDSWSLPVSRTPPQHEACLRRLNTGCHDRSRSNQRDPRAQRGLKAPTARPPSHLRAHPLAESHQTPSWRS